MICDENGIHDALLGRAIWLAKSNDARITLVDVVEAAPGELASLYGALPGNVAQDIELEVLAFHRSRLAQIGAPIKSEGIETSEVVLQGIAFIEIIRKVLRDQHDLVIKGAAGEGDGGPLFFASTDLHILRKCPCPVWIMKKSSQTQYARILAAVDPEPMDEQRSALDALVMDLATSLSAAERSELHVVNVWRLQGENSLRHSAFTRVPKETVEKMTEEKRRQSERKLKSLLFDYPETGGRRQVHLLKGEARQVIPEFAAGKKVELIVMGTVGRTGIRGLFVGNTAEAILNQVDCSVLAVKPPGFKTPVRLEPECDQGASSGKLLRAKGG
ncbi:universal stress protein [Pelagibius litoralis]|uniref:Universal stress protein n=1 Tax=Pelagibius litoralis TaxID=374515 RepID=A0A967KFR9_9PROT|nr:universal stress protein [Pelagibius litoralis]